MSAPLVFRIALYLLAADGVAALYVADFVGPRGVAVVGAALAGAWMLERLRPRLGPVLPVARALVPIAAAAAVVDALFVAETVLDALVRLLLFLVLYKLVTLQSIRETRTVSFLSFFMLVAASVSAFGVGFAVVFVVFVVAATWVTLFQHFLLEAEAAGAPPRLGAELAGWRGRPLFGLALSASAGVIFVTAGLFFVLPRIGLAALPLRPRLGQMVTGFSERVELGAYGAIATNSTVVMRVHIPEGTDHPERLADLRWRGIVLDEFDGRAWSVRHPRRTRLVPTSGGGLQLGVAYGTGPILRQEIYLEPIGTEIIFTAPRVLWVGLRASAVSVDDMGSLSVPPPSAGLHYTVESELPAAPGSRATDGRVAWSLDPWTQARYLQLPRLPERIPALARQIAAGSRDPYEAALRLSAFLSREFRYTLNLERLTTLDPLEEFLFVRRSGHCEYFAASLAVMLRSLGIPARVVNGFQRGAWNPYGRYFMVRLRDAHSWVETYVGAAGWVTLDPSPRAETEGWTAPGTVPLYLDALRLQWHRYVINWSLRDQLRAAHAIRRHAAGWGPWLQSVTARSGGSRVAWSVIAVGAAGLAVLLWWRERPPARGRAADGAPRFYVRALRLLAGRGLRPSPGETAREFCARVGGAAPACAPPFGEVTAAYERVRFGAARLTTEELAALDLCVATLTCTPATPGRPRQSQGLERPAPPRRSP